MDLHPQPLVTANAAPAVHVDPTQPSELVEFTTSGTFVRQFSVDPCVPTARLEVALIAPYIDAR
jgi:hypothetical protein